MGENKHKNLQEQGYFDKRDELREEWKHDTKKTNPTDKNIPYSQRKLAERKSREVDER